jgi:hypothetical protein
MKRLSMLAAAIAASFLLTNIRGTQPGPGPSFAADEAFDEDLRRVHLRSACRAGRALGIQIGSLVVTSVLLPIHGEHKGQINRQIEYAANCLLVRILAFNSNVAHRVVDPAPTKMK